MKNKLNKFIPLPNTRTHKTVKHAKRLVYVMYNIRI